MASTTTSHLCSHLVQYVILRRDLLTSLKWPLGALVAQACHACTAVLHIYREDEEVNEYLKYVDSMHKVVLEIKNEEELKELSSTLTTNGIKHKLWIEQPENYPTCIAIRPYVKSDVHKYLKKLKLFS